ncbi:HAD family hydrolase [Sphingobacterium sp. LRF_L2]|uniref:HAD family hydrolase n=1 Tax=Sphingobacterium sp. LRF_L2 TaxID=3369421 RepID=UPI003F64882F
MKLVIFDLDGTLIDTLTDLANSCNFALQKHGFPAHHEEAYKYFVGNGIRMLVERALPIQNRNDQTIESVKSDFVKHYEVHGQDFTKPYDGIPSTLEELSKKGCLFSVASNKYHEATRALVDHYFPNHRFNLVLGHRADKPPKPDPDIVLETLQRLDITKDDCLYVGDSSVDMLTATRAGVTAVGVTWGFRTEKELLENGAKFIIHHPSELLKLL